MCVDVKPVQKDRISSSLFLSALVLEASLVSFHCYSKVSVLICGQVKILLYVVEREPPVPPPGPELMFNVGDALLKWVRNT